MRNQWQEIHSMDDRQLEKFGTAHGVDMTQEFDDRAHARAFVCAQLLIEDPAKERKHAEELATEYAATQKDA